MKLKVFYVACVLSLSFSVRAQTAAGVAFDDTAAQGTEMTQAQGKEKILILDFAAVGVDAVLAQRVTTALAEAFVGRKDVAAMTLNELKSISDLEKDKAISGCQSDMACLAEISRWTQASLVLKGSVGRVGGNLIVNMSLIRAEDVSVEGRLSEVLGDEGEIESVTRSMLGRLLGWEVSAASTYRLPSGEELSFAVFDLASAGVPKDIAANLTQILSVEIKKVAESVVGREDVMAMLQLEKDKSLLGCTSDVSCLAEIGGALGVDRLVVGQVGKLSGNYVISLRLINPGAVEVENRISESFVGDEGVLIGAMRYASGRLLGVVAQEPGSLALSASQAEASIMLDGVEKGQTPAPPLQGLTPGRHSLRLIKDGFLDWQSDIYITSQQTTSQWVEMAERPAKWYQKWWVWASAGAVVLATGGTIAYMTQAPETGGGSVTF